MAHILPLAMLVACFRGVQSLVARPLATSHPSGAVTLPSGSVKEPRDGLQLLTSPPEVLRSHFSWPKNAHAASDKGDAIWGLLRRGIDPRAEAEEHLWGDNMFSPKLRRRLEAECRPISAGVGDSSAISADGTQKLLLTLEDGLSVECVLIPMLGGKSTTTTLCISSQVGCSRGCRFCSTGTMGLLRNLRAEEILTQVWLAQRLIRERELPPLLNIVFMGMGEPLNNLQQVRRAVEVLVHPRAFGLSRRTVCVSTVGPSPALIKKAATLLPCRLAWSVHAAGDELRRKLVPTTAHSMEQLRDAFVDGLASKPARLRGLMVELALIDGLNDSPRHADELAALLAPLGRDALVNLIPYNFNGLGLPGGELFAQPTRGAVHAFQQQMWTHQYLCTVRETRGDDERSACGQLATQAVQAGAAEGPNHAAAAGEADRAGAAERHRAADRARAMTAAEEAATPTPTVGGSMSESLSESTRGYVIIHRARSRSTVGFGASAFAGMARAEVAAVLPSHRITPSAITSPLAWSNVGDGTEEAARMHRDVPLLAEHVLASAIERCALSHGLYHHAGRGRTVQEAAEDAGAHVDAAAWSSWSVRVLQLGASTKPALPERADLLGPSEAILAAAFGCPASPAGSAECPPGASSPTSSPRLDDAPRHCTLVAVFGANSEAISSSEVHSEVHLLRLLGSGAAVSPHEYDYAPTGTPHKHGHRGLLGKYTKAVRPREHATSTAMVSELAFLMCNLARVRHGTTAMDPCMGGGSLLVAAGLLGATSLRGSDADPGASARTAASLAAATLPPAESLLTVAVADLLSGGGAAGGGDPAGANLDAIVCDPPYGIKEASLGTSVAADALRFAACRLRVGGRIAILLPISGGAQRGVQLHAQVAGLECVGEWRQDFKKSSLVRVLRVYERTDGAATGSAHGQRNNESCEALPRGTTHDETWHGGGPPNRVRARPRRGRS